MMPACEQLSCPLAWINLQRNRPGCTSEARVRTATSHRCDFKQITEPFDAQRTANYLVSVTLGVVGCATGPIELTLRFAADQSGRRLIKVERVYCIDSTTVLASLHVCREQAFQGESWLGLHLADTG